MGLLRKKKKTAESFHFRKVYFNSPPGKKYKNNLMEKNQNVLEYQLVSPIEG